MLADCSLAMLVVNAMLFITSLLEKISARILIGAGLLLAIIGLTVLAADRSDAWMYLGCWRRRRTEPRAGLGVSQPGTRQVVDQTGNLERFAGSPEHRRVAQFCVGANSLRPPPRPRLAGRAHRRREVPPGGRAQPRGVRRLRRISRFGSVITGTVSDQDGAARRSRTNKRLVESALPAHKD